MARAMQRKGFAGPGGAVVAVMIAIIVIVAVALPVTESVLYTQTCFNETNTSICNPTTTGTTATILNLLPLFLGLAALVTVAALFA
jgi:hypothetical protein